LNGTDELVGAVFQFTLPNAQNESGGLTAQRQSAKQSNQLAPQRSIHLIGVGDQRRRRLRLPWDKSSRFGQIDAIHTNNARSLPCSRRRDGARLKAMLS
jgi:hypothetical protein